MSRIAVRTLVRESLKTLRHPTRVLQLVNTQALVAHLRRESIRDIVKESWSAADGDGKLQRRQYDRYDDYVAHQRDKLTRLGAGKMEQYDARFRAALRERLSASQLVNAGMSVLCLAARRGTEVKAFADLGCFAVGIDLNPGETNPHVLPGDFHHVQFADRCVDVVFTNSLDHAFDIEKLLAEIQRVLKPGGLLIVEAAHGTQEGLKPGFYESFWWQRVDDLIETLDHHGFRGLVRGSFEFPWAGEHLCFRNAGVPTKPARNTASAPETAEVAV